MTFHTEHPFLPPPDQRDVVRQLRGRLPAPVTVVTTRAAGRPVGLTVSSLLLVQGDPALVVLMVDPLSDLGEVLGEGVRIAVSVLTTGDALLADTFAGLAPAPGGPFTAGTWVDSDFGPVRQGVSWLGAEVTRVAELGWYCEVAARIDRIEITDAPALIHQRGTYRT